MTTVYFAMALFLLANFAASLLRVLWGPSPADRMVTAQLFGSIGVGILLVLAEATALPALRDVALVFALLGALALVAFVGRVWPRLAESGEEP